jgi:hypothetical protein
LFCPCIMNVHMNDYMVLEISVDNS